jgi:hypothetical protein
MIQNRWTWRTVGGDDFAAEVTELRLASRLGFPRSPGEAERAESRFEKCKSLPVRPSRPIVFQKSSLPLCMGKKSNFNRPEYKRARY